MWVGKFWYSEMESNGTDQESFGSVIYYLESFGTASLKVMGLIWKVLILLLGVWKYWDRSGKFWYCDHLEVIVIWCHVTWEVLVPWSVGGGNTLVAYHFFAIHIRKLLLLVYQLKREPFLNHPAPPQFSAEVQSVSKARGRFRAVAFLARISAL